MTVNSNSTVIPSDTIKNINFPIPFFFLNFTLRNQSIKNTHGWLTSLFMVNLSKYTTMKKSTNFLNKIPTSHYQNPSNIFFCQSVAKEKTYFSISHTRPGIVRYFEMFENRYIHYRFAYVCLSSNLFYGINLWDVCILFYLPHFILYTPSIKLLRNNLTITIIQRNFISIHR